MTDDIRWGIVGTGTIAHAFAEGLATASGCTLEAVASRSAETADAFGDEFSIPRRYPTYQALAEDEAIDAIYIATPHHLHMDNTLLFLESGKAVLCEKPFAINAAQSRRMIETARSKGLFLMEAMWTRFFPIMTELRKLVAAGTIGELRMVTADFGFRAEAEEESRLFAPESGGGSLLDVGIYPISFASMLLGEARDLASLATLGQTGVDEQAGAVLRYDEGRLALAHFAIRTDTPQDAVIMGTKVQARIHPPFWCPSKMTISAEDEPDRVIDLPYTGNGYHYQAEEVAACLRAGKLESEIMPLDESQSLMETLDALRKQWGLRYPME